MKNLLISCFFPPYQNATGDYNYGYIDSLDEDFDVYMFRERILNNDFVFSSKIQRKEICKINKHSFIIISLKSIYFIFSVFLKLIFKKYDKYYSASFEVFNHIPLLFLCKFKKIDWTVIIADPMLGNSSHFSNKKILKFFKKIEKKSLEKATKVIFLSDGLVKHFSNYDISNYEVYYPKYSEKIVSNSTSINFLYTGSLYDSRSIIPLLNILLFVKKEFKITIIGKIENDELQRIKNHELFDHIDLVGFISQNELKKYVENASHLLLIDENIESFEYNYLYPSKLSFYFSTNLPIISLTRNNSITKEVLEKSGNISLSLSNEDVWNVVLNKYVLNEVKIDYKYYDLFYKKERM